MLDPFDAVLRAIVRDREDTRTPRKTQLLREDFGYAGSMDLVRRRLAQFAPEGSSGGAEDRLSPRGR
jgi:hypothetical protein